VLTALLVSRNLEETRKETQRLDDLIEESMQRDQREKIFRWLSPCEPSSNYNKANEQRFEGTGQWFFNSGVFESFKEGISPFLWLNGIPGCGKTVLSSSIIEDLQQSSSEASPAILYFYFDFNDIWKQTFDNALRSLLWQVANYPASPSTELQQLYDLSEEGKKQPSTESLVQSLGKALRALGRAVIVLDALDECTSRPVLLSWLAQITGQYIRNLQIIVTSRREHDIEVAFETWLSESAIVPPQELDVDTDISAYVSNRLRTDPQLRRWQGKLEVQNEIRSGLMDKANGM
jgi:Cdc6-like AAA superfamily ATPase